MVYKGVAMYGVVVALIMVVGNVAAQHEGGGVGVAGEFFHHDVDGTTVSVGTRFVCALEADGSEIGGAIVCWGRDRHGLLQPPSGTFIQVCTSEMYACGISIDGELKCWGDEAWGIDKPGSYLQVSCGMHHSCAVTKQNTLRCWGHNEHRQLQAPQGQFVQVSCGMDHSCAIDMDGGVKCWGYNYKGATDAPEGRFVQVSASGSRHTCGIRDDGDVVCWGNPSFGVTVPPAYDDVPYLQVTSARMFSCGLKESGVLVCWGDIDWYNKAGGDSQEYLEIASWRSTFCGITADAPHGVVCWGGDGVESRPMLATAV